MSCLVSSVQCPVTTSTPPSMTQTQATCSMACEVEKWKQNLLKTAVLPKKACLFHDVTQLLGDDRWCVQHASGKCVPRPPWHQDYGLCVTEAAVSNVQQRVHIAFHTVANDKDLPSPGELFGFGSGFSCKSLSKLHNDAASFKNAMKERNQDTCPHL